MKTVKALLVITAAVVISYSLASADVQQGKKLFNNPKFAGSTNAKSCNSCHPDGRGVEKAGEKMTFSLMGEEKSSLEDTVNGCIRMALKGKPIPTDSQHMKDIVEYIKSLKGKKFKKRNKPVKGC